MKPKPEYIEGPEAWQRFEGVMKNVPHSVIQEGIEELRKKAARNPNKRGPKRKPK
jgi:hypothetical protein